MSWEKKAGSAAFIARSPHRTAALTARKQRHRQHRKRSTKKPAARIARASSHGASKSASPQPTKARKAGIRPTRRSAQPQAAASSPPGSGASSRAAAIKMSQIQHGQGRNQ
ncbi:uncharacterized protein K452DRAFT_86439 [Aplosporella prunicola CBS 121167]|uniref:Uncharacterized protein n=1 Tax=Aplosporella prunicola CBS 121167 TaxID=1176127 RepID=A0A6A6B6K0_9PEZI|nr:uncharacterized protein K452DRAFT_86439 [Aplosporella prunicola CBS 121167]KAF2138411.1 hypothetical protein K452DRAFT_86439 [Aplosporella prunicola CBS 121167]